MIRPLAALLPPLRVAAAGRTLPAAFTALTLLVLLPAASDPLPPLTDYVNHLARMHILSDLPDNPVLQQFYEIRWAVIPNLMMDVLAPPLARVIGVMKAGQVFLMLTVLALASGPMVLHRALWGRFSPWPLLAFPLVYNGIFLYGLVNYLLGIGLSMWAAAAWIALRERPVWMRLTVSTLFVIALFFCHLFAVGLYGMTLTAYELRRLADKSRDRRAWFDCALFLLPFLPVLPLLASGPTMGLAGENVWESRGKVEGLYLTVELYRDGADMLFAGVLVAAGIWAARRGLLRMHAAGWALLNLGALVYLLMPRQLFGSWIADQRLPVALAFLLIGFIAPDLRGRLPRGAFYLFIAALTLARTGETWTHWAEAGRITDQVVQAASHIPRGAKVLTAYADSQSETPALAQVLGHAPLVSVLNRDSLASTIFSTPGKQILSIRPDYSDQVDREDGEPPIIAQLAQAADPLEGEKLNYWDDWPRRFDYVFVLYTEPDAAPLLPDLLTPAAHGTGFQLYQVIKPDQDAGADSTD